MSLTVKLTDLDKVHQFPKDSPLGAYRKITTESNNTLLASKIGNQGLNIRISPIGNVDLSPLSPYMDCEGVAIAEVVYKHEKPNVIVDVWIGPAQRPTMYSGSPTGDKMFGDYKKRLVEVQNEIRKWYYRLPPLSEASLEAVPE